MKSIKFDEIEAGKPYMIKISCDPPVIIFCKNVKDIRWREKELTTDGNVFTEITVLKSRFVSVRRGDTIIELDDKEFNEFIEAYNRYKEFFKSLDAF